MKLEDLKHEWEKDSEINHDCLADESVKVSKLHSKWYNLYTDAILYQQSISLEASQIYRKKWSFYKGYSNAEEYKDNPMYDIEKSKLTAKDLEILLDADEDIVVITKKMGLANIKVDFIKSVLDSIKYRGKDISNAIMARRLFAEFGI